MRETKQRRSLLALVLALLALLFGLAGVAYHFMGKPKPVPPDKAEFPGETTTDAERIAEEERFWDRLDKQKPQYNQGHRACFVEGTQVPVATGDPSHDNAFGGVLTDLMKVALTPPAKRPGRPGILLQNYDQLLSTCPTCGATYFEIDMVDITGGRPPGAAEKLQKSWNLRELCPELDKLEKKDWTYDEKAYARYLTQKTAGFPDSELGYTALSGAYCSNLSIGYGRDYRITGAAWYALAAAQFRATIDGGTAENPQAGSLIAMTLGEMYRLLGRQSDAKTYYAKARELGALDQKTTDILSDLEALNDKGDFALQLAPLKGMKEPPIGWYANQLLPNVNAELEYQRPFWSKLDDVAEIEKHIRGSLTHPAGWKPGP
jgi:hypothetical protein